MAAVLALALSGLLLMAMTGMFVGMGKAFTAVIDRSPADIMILNAESESLQDNPGMPRRLKPSIYMHPEVVAVDERQTGWGRFQNQPGEGGKPKSAGVQVMTIDTVPGSVTIPTDFDDSVRVALQEPYTVAVDQSALKGLGVKLGDLASFNGKTVKVAATIKGYPNIMQGMIIMSRETFRLLGMSSNSSRVGPLMVKVRDPSRAAIVRDQLNAASNGAYRAWLKPDLARANETALMKEMVIGLIIGFTSVMSIIIGIGITSQTLRGAILANIKEFASLRALGVSMGSLRRVVVELAFWVGVVGIGIATVLALATGGLAKSLGIPIAFPPWLLLAASVLLLAIALLSGMLSLGMLKKSQPADLLR